jgi:hypothetical protein
VSCPRNSRYIVAIKMGRRLGKRVGGSVYGRIGVWGTKTAFRHDYDDQEVSKKLTTLCKRRHADSPICSPIRCGGCEGEAVSQNPFLQNEGEVWQNDEPKCGRSNGPASGRTMRI